MSLAEIKATAHRLAEYRLDVGENRRTELSRWLFDAGVIGMYDQLVVMDFSDAEAGCHHTKPWNYHEAKRRSHLCES